jgi:hypothetical protein
LERPAEPFRWIGVKLTRNEMARADRDERKRSLWLKLFDRLGWVSPADFSGS